MEYVYTIPLNTQLKTEKLSLLLLVNPYDSFCSRVYRRDFP